MQFIRKLAVLALLLLLPLQGVAATLAAMRCLPFDARMVQQSDGDDTAGQENDRDTANVLADRLFCGQLSSAPPVASSATAPADLPAFESALSLLATLFFPEQPHRPPLVTGA